MRRREASINDVAITADNRRIHGPRAAGDTDCAAAPMSRPHALDDPAARRAVLTAADREFYAHGVAGVA